MKASRVPEEFAPRSSCLERASDSVWFLHGGIVQLGGRLGLFFIFFPGEAALLVRLSPPVRSPLIC